MGGGGGGGGIDLSSAPPTADTIHKIVGEMTQGQLYDLVWKMKLLMQQHPDQARQLLKSSPQLAYALLQAQIVLNLLTPGEVVQLFQSGGVSPAAAAAGSPAGMGGVGQGPSLIPQPATGLPPGVLPMGMAGPYGSVGGAPPVAAAGGLAGLPSLASLSALPSLSSISSLTSLPALRGAMAGMVGGPGIPPPGGAPPQIGGGGFVPTTGAPPPGMYAQPPPRSYEEQKQELLRQVPHPLPLLSFIKFGFIYLSIYLLLGHDSYARANPAVASRDETAVASNSATKSTEHRLWKIVSFICIQETTPINIPDRISCKPSDYVGHVIMRIIVTYLSDSQKAPLNFFDFFLPSSFFVALLSFGSFSQQAYLFVHTTAVYKIQMFILLAL
jgi:hypothetical protein